MEHNIYLISFLIILVLPMEEKVSRLTGSS